MRHKTRIPVSIGRYLTGIKWNTLDGHITSVMNIFIRPDGVRGRLSKYDIAEHLPMYVDSACTLLALLTYTGYLSRTKEGRSFYYDIMPLEDRQQARVAIGKLHEEFYYL